MQKATYLASIVFDRAAWPAHGGTVQFVQGNNVRVNATSFPWTGPPDLHPLLVALSFSPFTLVLSEPLLGKLDIWVKTSSLRASLRNDLQIPMELELTQLFRIVGPRLVVCPPSEDTMCEAPPVSVGKLVSSVRFKVLDELFWDGTIGGFVRGAVPFDVPSVPLSVVFAPHGASWFSQLCTESFAALIAKLPQIRPDVLSLRTGCTLVIDNAAPPLDIRVLTAEQLSAVPFLRMRLADFQAWSNSLAVPPVDGTASSLLSVRKALFLAELHPRFSVHPFHIHWKAAVWPVGTVFQTRVPRADWVFGVTSSAEAWATGLVSNQFALDHLFSQLRVPENLPEMWSIVSRNSWRLPLQKKRLMVRLSFYEPSPVERAMFRDTNRLMSSFGLVQKPDKTWSSKAGLLRLLKRDGVLASDRLEDCLEGFALTNARELLQPSRPQCIVCATNVCNAFLDACGHTFCDSCIQSHLHVGGTSCPVCRAELSDNGWTHVRRITSRRLHERLTFAKQEQIDSLARNLRGSLLFVAPNTECGSQVVSWVGADINIVTPRDPPLKDGSFDHIVCTTASLPSNNTVRLLHELFQKHSTDTTTLHVLVERGGPSEEDTVWVRDFCRCYPNLIEMSTYL